MKLIPLTRGMFAKVDDADYAWLSQLSWYACPDKYGSWRANSNVRGSDGRRRTMPMHCLIFGRKHVDHIDHDTLNNQRSNLRAYEGGQNVHNSRKLKLRTSGFKGVYWNKQISKWSAKAAIGEPRENGHRRQKYLGSFASEVDAALAYDAVAREHFGEFACLNFPDHRSVKLATQS